MRSGSQAGAGAWGALIFAVALALPLSASAGCPEGADCPGDAAWAPNQPPTRQGSPPPATASHVRLVIQYELGVGPPYANNGLGSTVHAVGADLSWSLGSVTRYHLNISYVNEVGSVDPPSGFRVEPLRFSWTIPIDWGGNARLELEPFVSPLEFSDFVADNIPPLPGQLPVQSSLVFGASVGLQIAIAVGRFRGFVQPIGLEVDYSVQNLPPSAGELPSQTFFHLAYRPGIGVGMDL